MVQVYWLAFDFLALHTGKLADGVVRLAGGQLLNADSSVTFDLLSPFLRTHSIFFFFFYIRIAPQQAVLWQIVLLPTIRRLMMAHATH